MSVLLVYSVSVSYGDIQRQCWVVVARDSDHNGMPYEASDEEVVHTYAYGEVHEGDLRVAVVARLQLGDSDLLRQEGGMSVQDKAEDSLLMVGMGMGEHMRCGMDPSDVHHRRDVQGEVGDRDDDMDASALHSMLNVVVFQQVLLHCPSYFPF